jgi:hypothetical protein
MLFKETKVNGGKKFCPSPKSPFFPGQRHLLFPPQRSTKIHDISEKNFTTKSNRTKGSKSKKEGEKRVLS